MAKLEIDTAIYCYPWTFQWYRKPLDDCDHVWEQTRSEDCWAEWTCTKCKGRGRCDVWD